MNSLVESVVLTKYKVSGTVMSKTINKFDWSIAANCLMTDIKLFSKKGKESKMFKVEQRVFSDPIVIMFYKEGSAAVLYCPKLAKHFAEGKICSGSIVNRRRN